MPERLSILNEDSKVLPGPQFLHKLIRWDRDTCALDFLDVDGQRRLYTYRSLRTSVLLTVSALQTIQGNGNEKAWKQPRIIPILLPQSPGLYIAILAILEAGAAFCPISLDAPPDRIKFVLEDVSAEVIITTREYEHLVTWNDGPRVMLIESEPSIPQSYNDPDSKVPQTTRPQDLAYIMYTSGSTGTPKGVAVSHLAVSQSLLAHDKYIPPFNRFLQFAAPSFDVSVFEIFFPFFRGSTLVGCRRSQMLNDLTGVINRLEVDAVELTPTVVSSLIQYRSSVPGLNLLMTIGEMLTRPVIDSFGRSAERDGILYAMYGPTEAAIHCTINPQTEAGARVGNIGVPLDTVSVFVIDGEDTCNSRAKVNLLPVEELGELVLGGPQLANGYLNRKEQNEASFVNVRGQRAYRTGDRARIMSNGTIEIYGRMSSGQVKLRGQRVELGEIEEAIYRHPYIKTVMVSVLHGILVAFVLASNPNVTAQDVLETCSTWLPAFMVPNDVVLLDAFPYLPSGKIDKIKLESDFERGRKDESDRATERGTDAEYVISQIIRDLLGADISHRARLAAYGLDSLVAIRLAPLLRSAGFNINAVDILKADNIQSLAYSCENNHENQHSVPLPPAAIHNFLRDASIELTLSKENLDPDDIEYTMPCTPLQDAMLSETAMDGIAYKNRIVLEVSPHFSTNHIQRVLQALAQNNPMLRTGFIELPTDRSTYIQIIWKSLPLSQLAVVKDPFGDFHQTSILHPLYVKITNYENHTRLSLQIHHALYDAWSLELVLDDLDAIFCGKQPEIRPSFDHVVQAHHDKSNTEDTWLSRGYWKDHLLEYDFVPIPNFNSLTNTKRELSVTAFQTSISTRELESTAKSLCVSPQSLFQAAYAVIMSSYLNTKDICFGTVFSGRTSWIIGIEDIVGPCLATLPIRTDLTAASRMADLARQLNLTNRKHLGHGSLPLQEIKRACGTDPREPLFDSILIWQQTLHEYDHTRDHVKLIDSTDFLEFNLTLEIRPTAGNVSVTVNYQSSVFPPQQIDLLLRQLDQVVAAIIRAPETSMSLLDAILSEDLLSSENVNPQIGPIPGSLTSNIELMAINQPDKPALEIADHIEIDRLNIVQVTYGELNSQANKIAHYMISKGVLPDELVCIFMEKTTELYISILATSKAGAGYVPLTPDTPPNRLRQIISDANIKVILTNSSLDAHLACHKSVDIIFIDTLDVRMLSSTNPSLKFEPDNLAYCVFTSGSTGVPKGVLVTNGNLLSNLQILAELYPHSQKSKLLQSCSQAFDVSVFEIFFAWHIGACLCSAVKEVLFRDIELGICALNITHLSLTPTVAALVDPENVPKVEFLVTAGEAVTAKVFKAWADRGLHQGYGPSETTNICTLRSNVTKYHAINNIGQPLNNTSVFVLSPGDEFSLTPRGGEGEFCFGGAQVGKGYLDPNQSTGKFIEHPKYGKLYRSGDYGRLLPDGSLSFTGRKDDQVKLRGQRVELGEINSVLLRSPEVEDCITLILEGQSQTDQRIVCFWMPNGSSTREFAGLTPVSSIAEKLFASIAEALPIYMIPSALIPVSCLPSTAQGKVDRRRLRSYYRSLKLSYLNHVSKSQKRHSNHVWSVLEEKIAHIVAKIAGVISSDVEPDTSFYSLGIDSVSAISLSRALRDELKINTDISDVLKYQSASRLASRISQTGSPPKRATSLDAHQFGFDPKFLAATTKAFEKAGRFVEQILPCTPLQEAMLSTAEASSDHTYVNRMILKIKVSEAEFQSVWAEMIKRHEILRTCFVRTSHPRFAYAQVVLSDFNPNWNVIDRSGFNSNSNFDVHDTGRTEYNPPYSLRFIRSLKSTKLVLSMHHAIYDGFAISVLFEEIEIALQKMVLPAQVSFFPFLQYMTSINLSAADEYWGNLLEGCYPTRFPYSREATRNPDHGQQQTSIIKAHSQGRLSWIYGQIKAHDSSLLVVCQTVWASLLSAHLNEADICFGNVVSGRTVPVENVDRLVAPCFNTIPVRIKETDKLSFLETFRVLQSQAIDCLPFQLTPMRRIQSHSGIESLRLFDTLLILQQPVRQLDPSMWSVVEESGAMDVPVVIEITPQPESDTIELALHSHRRYMSGGEAAELLKTFDSILRIALQNPRRPMISNSTATILNDRERNYETNRRDSHNEEDRSENFESMNAMEMVIRDVIANFTDISRARIQRHKTIQQLGLDSISAVQVAADLRKHGYNIMGSDVLQHPSVSQLAIHLTGRKEKLQAPPETYQFHEFDQRYRASTCSRLKRLSEDIEAIRPCTPVQCGMLVRSLYTDGQEYINRICYELMPGTSLCKLRDAWQACMRQREMLRTGFVEIDDAKFPFAMVTYTQDASSLPWTESKTSFSHRDSFGFSAQTILNFLSNCPWTLEVLEEGDATFLRFTAHHAIYDAQSLELILSDVARCYIAKATPFPGDQISINPVLGAILKANDQNEAARENFWRVENKMCINRFPDLTPLCESTTRSSVQEKILSLSMVQLENLCREQGVSVQAVGQVAWGRLLSSYIGEPSVTFGLTLSGRTGFDGSNRYAFPTIVTLPVSSNVVGTNAELLNRTMRSISQLYEHQFTPLSSIQKWAGNAEGKLFDTLFSYQKTKGSQKTAKPPFKIVREEASADYAISMEIQPIEEGIVQLRLTFKESLIPIEQAKLILEQYDALLLDTLQNSEGSCDVVPTANVNLLSITPAVQPTLFSPIELLHEFVEIQARLIPQKVALEFTTSKGPGDLTTRPWNFEQLDQKGNNIANLLLDHGFSNGDLIAICFDKCPEASFAILGILKAGCAYVPLDPNAPPDRLKLIVEDSRSGLILSTGEVAQTLSKVFADASTWHNYIKVLDVGDAGLFTGLGIRKPILARPIDPQDTCYCLYTSGTTGTPKGCEITHENAIQAMMSFRKLFEGHWTEHSKWLQFASFHFDVSILEQFWSWSVGICVASAPRDLIFEDIPGMITKLGITHIDLTPSLARLLRPNEVPCLMKGVFITGGEQLRQEILDAWGDYECIYNGYGPTEATIGVTMYPRVPKNGKPSNIGQQFNNVKSYVFKLGTTQLVLRGAIGELCVSGKLIGKGYLNRPDLTQERFPYLDEFGERIYRTGDLVRILHDGCFLFLGRADDQVKLRGQRLELSEINEVIKKQVHDIQDVVTMVLKHNEQQKEQLVTFFVAVSVRHTTHSNADFVSSLRHVCRGRLPGYMVPTYFVALEKLPLSANNKTDLKELAKIFYNMSISDLQILDSTGNMTKKWTVKGQGVLKVLARSFNVEKETLNQSSNIFELGMDSISMIGLTRDLQKAGFSNATLSIVMKNTSIDSLVHVLASDTTEDDNSHRFLATSQRIAAFAHKHKVLVADELGIDASDIECLAPCTPSQEGMIYRFLGTDEPLYFTTFNFILDDSVDEGQLREAWTRTVSHLQILRTKFVLTVDGCAQVVLHKYNPSWSKASMHGARDVEIQLISPDQRAEICKIEKTTALANPYRISIIHIESRRIMSLNIFHGLYDGISLSILLRKVRQEYQNIPIIDYGPPFHYVLPYGPLTSAENAEAFWRAAFSDHTYHPLPCLRSSTIHARGKDILITKTILASEVQHHYCLRSQLGITNQAIVLAAWSSVLATILQPYSAPSFFLTQGLVLAGRSFSIPQSSDSTSIDPQSTIGPLLNTIPFHVNIYKGMSWKELLQRCHTFCVQVVADGLVHTPLRDVLRWCGGGSSADYSNHGKERELFDTLFVFQHEKTPDEDAEGDGELWRPLPSESIADYPLAFEAQLGNNGDMVLTLMGQKDFLDDIAAADILANVEKALQDLKSPDEAIYSLGGTESIQTYHDAAVQTLPSPTTLSTIQSKAFTWTPEAQLMKSEIESLSRIGDMNEHSSIFSLGLDSIDIIKLVSRLRKQDIHIPVSSVVKSQTIAKMVNKISKIQPRSERPMANLKEYEQRLMTHLRAAGKLSIDGAAVLPATGLQEAMVAEMIASGYTRYFNHEVFRVASHVDMQKLRNAWDTVVNKNDILRTRFVEIDHVDLPMSFAQVICRSTESCWHGMQLPSSADLQEEIRKVVRSAAAMAKQGNLLHLHDIRHGKDRYLVLSIAHALYDGWSLQALHQDVWEAYHGSLGTRPDPRRTLELILDIDGPEIERFWKTSLNGLQKSAFPQRLNHDVDTSEAIHRQERLSSHPLEKIQAFCRSMSINLQTLGQTSWAMLLATYLKQLDVVFGTVLSCRDTEESNELMFPLMNTVAVRSVIHGSISELLHYMQENGNLIRRYQHFPLRKAQALAKIHDGKLFDTLFVHQGRDRGTISGKNRLYESVESVAEVEFAVCVEMEIAHDRIVWRAACKDSVLTAADTETLLDRLDNVLGTIIEHSEFQSILSSFEGISIGGLPRFRIKKFQSAHKISQPASTLGSKEWTTTQMTIRKVLSQVSKVPEKQIDHYQSIFHLGLDSISAIKVSSILRRGGIKLGVNDIMKHMTIASIANAINEIENGLAENSREVDDVLAELMKDIDREDVVQRARINPENIEDILPVTAGQLYMLVRWQASSGTLFAGTFEYVITGSLNVERLDSAWTALLKKHSILRTIFVVLDDGSPLAVQVVLREAENNIRWATSPTLHNNVTLTAPLSLNVKEREDDTLLYLQIHHALYDGVSLPLLLHDLQTLYTNSEASITVDSGFRRFVAQSCDRQTQRLQRQQDFWKSYLSISTLLSPKHVPISGSDRRVEVFEPGNRIENVALVAQRRGVSVDTVLLAAFSKVYSRMRNIEVGDATQPATAIEHDNDVVFGLYLANRAVYDEDLSSLLAPTLNLLPIRIDPVGSLADIAQRVQFDLRKLSNADVTGTSLAEIYEWTGVRVNCFVNILKLADNDSSAQSISTQILEEHGYNSRRRRAEIVELQFDPLPRAAAEKFYEAYLPSIDIEMQVTDAGASLDIGIFAPWEHMHVEDAMRVVEEMRAQLSALE